jgi:hypothetical protein
MLVTSNRWTGFLVGHLSTMTVILFQSLPYDSSEKWIMLGFPAGSQFLGSGVDYDPTSALLLIPASPMHTVSDFVSLLPFASPEEKKITTNSQRAAATVTELPARLAAAGDFAGYARKQIASLPGLYR